MAILSDLSRDLSILVARLGRQVVSVRSAGGAASGFAWRDGLVVTADEALESEEGLSVVTAEGTLPATLVGRDPSTDVALLRVEGALPAPLPLDAGGSRAAGEVALAVGRDGEGPVAAMGILGAAGPAWRSLRGGTIDARLRLDLRLPRAAEGGLVADAEGRPYGMAVFGPRRAALVIPAATIERVAPRLVEKGRVARGYLGLGLQPVAVEGGGAGVVVVSVDPEGPGRRAGVIQGDIIRHVDGEPLGSMRAMLARLGPDSVGQALDLGILRGGASLSVSLTVAERPEA